MNCPRCGGGNGPGAQYCGACGKRLPEAKAAHPAAKAVARPVAKPVEAAEPKPKVGLSPASLAQRPVAPGLANALAHPWTGITPASLERRLKAGAVDLVVFFALLGLGGLFDESDPDVLPGLFFFWIYKAGFEWGKHQGSLAKQRHKVKVVMLDGARMTLRVATIRWVAWILSTVLLGLGHAMAIYTPGRRALHDLIADTIVVPADYASPPGKSWEEEVKELVARVESAAQSRPRE